MKRSQFVPGVLFHMPGKNRHQVFRLEELSNSLRLIEKAGGLYDGRLLPSRERESWHFKLNSRGIQLWTVADTVYLYSKTIPFEDLTIAEIPSTATNPVSQ